MKTKQLHALLYVVLAINLVFIISCGKTEKVRKYKEKEQETASTTSNAPAPAPGTKTAPGAGSAHGHFKWETPGDWLEDKTSSGFRLAAFTIKAPGSNNSTALCTIVPLSGEAGGLKANVERWLGQINAENAEAELPIDTADRLLKSQEKFLAGGQFPGVLIDFTPLTTRETDKSIIAAVISVQGNSIFIKMTGEKSLLNQNKEKFKALCQSFTL